MGFFFVCATDTMNKLSLDKIWGFTVYLGQDRKQKVQKKKKKCGKI